MVYEYRCPRCDRPFEVYASLAEKERGLSPRCPECGSEDVHRVFTPVMVLGARTGEGRFESASNGHASGGGCCCGGACGCGH